MEFLVVADDLTGANDAGAAFAARGHGTVIDVDGSGADAASLADEAGQTDPGDASPAATDADVLVVNTDSRYSDPETAARRVRSAVECAPDAVVYKKVDSTLRGNLVAEIDAAMGASGADLALVAPAFPATGRITDGGYHLVDGTRVAETAAGRDEKGPESSHLPTLLEESAYPVVHHSLDDVGDAGELADAFEELAAAHDGVLVVPDATTDDHLDVLATGAADAAIDVLYVGSGGLASHVRADGPTTVLGVVGSVAPETFAQLDALPPERVVAMDPELVVTDPEAAVADAVDAVGARFADADDPWVVVTAATAREDVEATLAAGRAAGVGEQRVREQVADALGATARAVASDRDLDGLFVTGGAVATATLDALDATSVRLTGHQVEPGVPLGHIEGGAADRLACVTKAGAFGGETAIVNGLRFLGRYDG